MLSPATSFFLSSLLVAASLASPFPESSLHPRAACAGNTATTRSEWCDFSIDTDYTTVVPDTGVTREFWLELNDVTVAPDGVSRTAMSVNGSIPGPTLIVDWGDTVIVHVLNSLTTSGNGTSIHFHGIRQNYTNQNDGVASVTQCPAAPGDSLTYTWRATQYGTTWYHSHFALQAWEGVFGAIIINGPATADYDEDLGTITLADWAHLTADELYSSAQTSGPPTLDNGLINGTNVYNDTDTGVVTGSRFTTSFTSGVSYRLRLINVAIDTHFRFSIDNHTMTVIASDLVPIVPFTTTVLSIGIAQRYDIIVTADQADVADDFWMRAIPQAACSDNDNSANIKGIVSYTSTVSDPTTTGYDYTDGCDDETDNIVPYISKTVGSAEISTSEAVSIAIVDTLFKWTLNTTSLLLDWANPTIAQVLNGSTAYDAEQSVIALDEADVWFYLVIDTTIGVTHPIHLHGHDFFILAQGTGTYSSSVTLNLSNPPRRDVAMLPASGYLVIAFQTDNPGVWLMHCHIGWHTAEGFALQFLERSDEIAGITDATTVSDTCDSWTTFQTANSIVQDDSGV